MPAPISATPGVQGSGKVSGQGIVEGEEELQAGIGTHRRRVQAPPSTLAVKETGLGPPLWTAEGGTQGLCGDPECESPRVSSVSRVPCINFRDLRGNPIAGAPPSPLPRANLPRLLYNRPESGGSSHHNYSDPSSGRNTYCGDPSKVWHQHCEHGTA